MRELKAEVIGIGTELLLGQIANTNAQWISEKLATRGISVYYHQVVGDNPGRIQEALTLSAARADLIFITGGLGPTDDDITREMMAEFVGRPLIKSEEAMKQLAAFFTARQRSMSENNKKQAQVIEGSTLINNGVGTAPGMIIPWQEKFFFIMPGVPNEMKMMMKETVLPFIRETYDIDDVIRSKMLRFIGIGESQLEMEVKEIIDRQTNPTIAPLASDGEVALRLTAKASTNDQAERLIKDVELQLIERVGDFLYGEDGDSIASAVVKLLEMKGLTLSAAESLTGGRFSDWLVSVPGASQVFKGSIVTYQNEIKTDVLEVPTSVIASDGPVSHACCYQMAKRIKEKFNSDIGISFTGVAGPGPFDGHEAGTVYIGIYQDDEHYAVEKYQFVNNREMNRTRSVKKGLEQLYYLLSSMK